MARPSTALLVAATIAGAVFANSTVAQDVPVRGALLAITDRLEDGYVRRVSDTHPDGENIGPGDYFYAGDRIGLVKVAVTVNICGHETDHSALVAQLQLDVPAECDPPAAAPLSRGAAFASIDVPAAPYASTIEHTVAANETIYSIGRRYGVTPASIIAQNNLQAPDRILVGERLVIAGGEPAALGTPAATHVIATSSTPNLPGGTNFVHTIASGESLYTIARRYGVTTQAIAEANNLSSPDQISVGQKVIIPGPADILATRAPIVQVASGPTPVPVGAISSIVTAAAVATQTASLPAAGPEPVLSGSDKFRWPVSGRVLLDFASSRGTGVNIEAPEGTPVKAAENGSVIYVGSGIEGYGNLVLIRHSNGYVSAYAHLQSVSVAKGDIVQRGDTIGAVGMTGSVTAPQLHFELRKGATPVDPLPLLAS